MPKSANAEITTTCSFGGGSKPFTEYLFKYLDLLKKKEKEKASRT